MKLFKVDFKPVQPTNWCLIILAESTKEAAEIASETIMHASRFTVEEISMDKSKVVVYRDGDY